MDTNTTIPSTIESTSVAAVKINRNNLRGAISICNTGSGILYIFGAEASIAVPALARAVLQQDQTFTSSHKGDFWVLSSVVGPEDIPVEEDF